MIQNKKTFKKLSVLATALMLGLGANAQDGSNNGKVKTNKLTVTVGEFYSLTLSNDNATILLDSEEKFATGSESLPIEMKIFSSKKYAVTAQVSSDVFNGVADNTIVNTNNIDLIVTQSEANLGSSISARGNNSLKNDLPEQIVSSTLPTKGDSFSLVYKIPSQNTTAFLDQYGKTISTQITYTLLPL